MNAFPSPLRGAQYRRLNLRDRAVAIWVRATEVLALIGGWLFAALGLWAGFWPFTLSAEDGPATPTELLEYRRVQVRSEQLAEFAKGYLPLRETEFEQLLAAVRQNAGGTAPSAIGCARAEYSARFENDALVDGVGQCEIRAGRDLPAFWAWGDSQLPITEPTWQNDPPRPALVGLVSTGQQAVLVEQPGRLRFRWSLRGRRTNREVVSFTFHGPRAVLQTLTLDLPSALTPQCPAAIVTPMPASADAPSRRVWNIQWPGDSELELRIALEVGRRTSQSASRVRQALHYAIDVSGLELQADLHVDVTGEPLQVLVLSADRRLQVGTVRLGDKMLAWSRRAGDPAGTMDDLVIPLPDLAGDDRRLQLTALAPAEFGTRWRLPMLQPRGALWLEGEAHVTVFEPLVATQLEVQGGRLVFAVAGERRRTWQVRLHEPEGQITLSADLPPSRLKIRAGTTIAVDRVSMTGRFLADLVPQSGPVQRLEAELPRAWLIDNVESLEGPTVEDYQLATGPTAGRQLLRLRLREPLAAGKLLRLSIRARRPPPAPNTPVASDQLRLVRFRDGNGPPHEVTHVVAVNSAPNIRLRFSGDQAVTWLEPSELLDSDEALIEFHGGGRLFVADREAEELELRVERDRPRFRGEIEVTAMVRGGRLVESYRLRLIPDSSLLDRVPVFVSQSRPAPLRWEVQEPAGIVPTVRQIPRVEGGTESSGETWEIAFSRPLAEPVTLFAERSTAWDETRAVSLASLPEAAEQQGTLRLAAEFGPVHWMNQGLAPLADIPEEDARQAAASLGVVPGTVTFFHYEPAGRGSAVVTPDELDATQARVWAWRSTFTTVASVDGSLRHRCEYEIENVGATEATFDIPAAMRLQRLLVNGIDRTPPHYERAETQLQRLVRCTLPLDSPRVNLQLELSAHHAVLGASTRLATPRIVASFPVLEQQWQVSLPGGWAVTSVRPPDSSNRPSSVMGRFEQDSLWPAERWSDRLFGLLLRPSAGAPRTARDGGDGWQLPTVDSDAAAMPERVPSSLAWHTFSVDLPASGVVQLGIHRTQVLQSYAWVALLLTAGFGGWISRRWPVVWPLLVLVAGLVALSVSAIISLVANGAFLGFLFAPLVATGFGRAFAKTQASSDAGRANRSARRLLPAAPLIFLAVVAALCEPNARTPRAGGQEEPRRAETTQPPLDRSRLIYKVLVPIDDQRQRSSEYVHLPREFYHELRRRAAAGAADAGAWVMRSADYHATLDDNGDKPAVDLVAEYLVEVRRPQASITWPFSRDQVTVIEARVTRGSEAIESEWQPSEVGWSLTVAEPGSYRFTFRLRAAPLARGGNFVELAIPPVAASRLHLRSANMSRRLALLDGVSGPEQVGQREERSLALGPSRKLKLGWSAEADLPTTAFAEQLFWLNIRPGSVQLDTVLRMPSNSVPASRLLRLRLDPQLRPLPVAVSPGIVRAQFLPGNPATYLVELADADEPPEVRLSFLITGSSGVGRVMAPRIEWLDGRTERRWLGVTVASTLELARHEGSSLEPINVPAFLQAWGPTESLPLVAYRLPSDDEPCVLSVRQRDSEWTGVESSTYVLRRDRCELQFAAELTPGPLPHFQYDLVRTGVVRIFDVTVVEGSESQVHPVHWSTDAQGTLHVLADQPLAGPHRLQIRGDFSLPFDKQSPLPTIALVARRPVPRTMRIVRHSSVEVDRVSADGWREWLAAEESETAQDPSHRLVGAWSWMPSADETEPASPLVRMRQNRPRVRGRLLTVMHRNRNAWEVAVAGQLQVDRGTSEFVRLEIPPECTGPWVNADGTTWTSHEVPGQTRAYLLGSAPPERAGEAWDFALRGPLKFARQERVRAPDIQLLDAATVDRYVALPSYDQRQRILWETSGLRAVVQPDVWLEQALEQGSRESKLDGTAVTDGTDGTDGAQLTADVGQSGQYQLYQVVAPRFQATVADVDDESTDARVLRAEHAWHDDGNAGGWGQSRLVVQTGSLPSCVIDLPKHLRLLQVRVAGALALVDQTDDGGWRIPLADDRSNQDIQLLYQATAHEGVATPRLPAGQIPRVRQWITDETVRSKPEMAASRTDGRDRLAAGVVLVALMIAGMWAGTWVSWWDWIAASPALPAVVLGILWWFWLEPAFVGALIATAGILAANLPATFRLGRRRGL